MTVSRERLPGLRVAHVDRDRVERPVLEVEAGQPEVGRRPEARSSSRRGTTSGSTTARFGRVAQRLPDRAAEP